MNVEDLPSPLAWACARAAPAERPSAAQVREAVVALLELCCARLLSGLATHPDTLPFEVESALRLTLLAPTGAEGWLDLYAALDHAGATALLGWPAEPPAPVRAAGGVLPWLEQALEAPEPASDTVATLCALARSAGGLSTPWVVLDHLQGPQGVLVEARRLLGTGWAPILVRPVARALPEGPCFWDGQGAPLPIPRWLVRWDPASADLRFTAGRDGRRHLWRSHRRPGDLEVSTDAPPDLPPFLHDPTFRTPAGVERLDPNAQTGAFHRSGGEAGRSPPPEPPGLAPAVPGSSLALRVVAGPDLQRWVSLQPGQPVTLGRQADAASFPMHHHQVSRVHARVVLEGSRASVEDLGSTNGTQVFSPVPGLPARTLRSERAGLHPGDTVGVGPVLVRLEWLAPERVSRLEELARLAEDQEGRDPNTHLLRPQALREILPEPLRSELREGGRPLPGQPPLLGLLCYVDRLAAVHAQHGERPADRAFRDVARILQYEVDASLGGPLASAAASWTRVGYGELLLPVVGGSEAAVLAEGERLLGLVAAHPFEAPVERLTLTASLVAKEPGEPATEWLRRARRLLQDGRTHHGRNRVYR